MCQDRQDSPSSPSQNPAHAATSGDEWKQISNKFDFWKQSPATVSTCRRTLAHVEICGGFCLQPLAHAGISGDFCIRRQQYPLVVACAMARAWEDYFDLIQGLVGILISLVCVDTFTLTSICGPYYCHRALPRVQSITISYA
jgi:hypothetical protein